MPVAKPRLRAPERRSMIVTAALSEFADRGYDAASMGRIARASGVARPVLYDHFPSKLALFVELLSEQHAALLRHLEAGIQAQEPMRERMRGAYDAYFAFAEQHPVAWRLLFAEHPPVDDAAAEAQRRCRQESNRMLAAMIAADARQAGFDPDSALGRMVFVVHQEALAALVQWWQGHPEVERAAVSEAAMAALWTGLSGEW